MKIKNTYLLLVTIIGLVSLVMYTTYAMFTASVDVGDFVDLTVSNLPTDTNVVEYERLNINAGETKIIDLNINNTTSNSLYYGVWYEMIEPTTINNDIVIAKLDTSASETIGQLATNSNSVVTLIVENNTSDSLVINLGVAYSLTSSLNLPTNRNLVTEEASDGEIAYEKIIALSKGNTWESGAKGLYEVSYKKENGNIIGKDYRYIGSSPDNYIKFNNDLYQIIGVFDENTHGKTGEYLVKIISADIITMGTWGSINTTVNSGTFSTIQNDWTGKQYTTPVNSNILFNQYFLNKTNTSGTYGNCSNWTYFNFGEDNITKNCDLIVRYGIDSTYRNYIETVTWHLNGYSSRELNANNYYLCERGMYTNCTSANNGAAASSTEAKIGLMYVSDYMYASGYKASNNNQTALEAGVYNTVQNWIFKGEEWMITPQSNSSNYVFYVNSSGNVTTFYYSYSMRPTFYLKSNVEINGGDGTFENPFTIK